MLIEGENIVIKTVTVIGANGTMGQNISGIFASFGNAKVYMVCRSLDAAKKAKEKASLSVKAETIDKNLIPATYDDLEMCIPSSDLVFESVAENFEIKKQVYAQINKYISPNAIIGTGTSGLSINELSNFFDENLKQNFMGIHFFNPPYNMTLCEVIPSKHTNKEVLENTKEYLSSKLFRKVVQVKDAAAFMGNRIGFQFINEALQYAEIYKDKGGIDFIDSILGPFTGRNMPPLSTADFVGLDIHKAIVDNVYDNTNDYAHETFKLPEYIEKLISEGKLGRKTGCGLYQLVVKDDGSKVINTYDIATDTFREKKKYQFDFATKMKKEFNKGNYKEAFECLYKDESIEAKLCAEFLIKYVIYSIATTKAIGETIHDADDVMATGFNWVPALAVVDAFGGVDCFKKIAKEKLDKEYFSIVDIEEVLENVPKSNYDFRPFFKAR